MTRTICPNCGMEFKYHNSFTLHHRACKNLPPIAELRRDVKRMSFSTSLKEMGEHYGVSPTFLKKMLDYHGIPWPRTVRMPEKINRKPKPKRVPNGKPTYQQYENLSVAVLHRAIKDAHKGSTEAAEFLRSEEARKYMDALDIDQGMILRRLRLPISELELGELVL